MKPGSTGRNVPKELAKNKLITKEKDKEKMYLFISISSFIYFSSLILFICQFISICVSGMSPYLKTVSYSGTVVRINNEKKKSLRI